MNVDYSKKLEKLRSRRAAPSTFTKGGVTFDSVTAASSLKPALESFEGKGQGDATRYALGCIAEVPPEYTAISLRDGERIASQLKSQNVKDVETKLQGSVPLNIHIYTSSDVDLLVLAKWFVTLESPVQTPGSYTYLDITPSKELAALRTFCEAHLATRYPAADVNTSGAKSIAVSGGSLARKVDVVPAHWVDTVEYQRTKIEKFRDVQIYDKSNKVAIRNSPFLHMAMVENKDFQVDGYAKKAIRLLKCLARDADSDIAISSYDIASLIFHMEDSELRLPNVFFPLQLLNRVEFYLRWLEDNPYNASSLVTPDGSRKILDKPEKMVALKQLREELTQAIENIGAEYNNAVRYTFDNSRAHELARAAVDSAVIY
ncbi:hypothetical protein F3J16_10010 [Burkholderia sp. Ap-962]|uniref:hypothetical protein n=1 Tax=Burkholderia sp. Ap-962 TaxID=2608333 RepID=UPI00141FE0B9|nr:hypothetical protein [Burkholderia sp. Ap-962]NIF70515.1 hypothetical protein [Burkholderia sp. Ap-962]